MNKRQPIAIVDIVHALERESANADTDPRWLAATALREMDCWKTRTIMCDVDERPSALSASVSADAERS